MKIVNSKDIQIAQLILIYLQENYHDFDDKYIQALYICRNENIIEPIVTNAFNEISFIQPEYIYRKLELKDIVYDGKQWINSKETQLLLGI